MKSSLPELLFDSVPDNAVSQLLCQKAITAMFTSTSRLENVFTPHVDIGSSLTPLVEFA